MAIPLTERLGLLNKRRAVDAHKAAPFRTTVTVEPRGATFGTPPMPDAHSVLGEQPITGSGRPARRPHITLEYRGVASAQTGKETPVAEEPRRRRGKFVTYDAGAAAQTDAISRIAELFTMLQVPPEARVKIWDQLAKDRGLITAHLNILEETAKTM